MNFIVVLGLIALLSTSGSAEWEEEDVVEEEEEWVEMDGNSEWFPEILKMAADHLAISNLTDTEFTVKPIQIISAFEREDEVFEYELELKVW
ncbi:hypothetical protein HDE_14492 [Halotydeus destructor]|nr:hypothetical protein HDE_14492 [Halotydeus destructor]